MDVPSTRNTFPRRVWFDSLVSTKGHLYLVSVGRRWGGTQEVHKAHRCAVQFTDFVLKKIVLFLVLIHLVQSTEQFEVDFIKHYSFL